MPVHNHLASGAAGTGPTNPQNATWGTQAGRTPPPTYSSGAAGVTMSPLALSVTGSGLPHTNMQPYQVVTFIIALQGIFPPRQ
jgi:microcystin-dependent protein